MRTYRWLCWLPALSWASLIFWASCQQIHQTPTWWFPNADKVIHIFLFGTLAAFLYLPLHATHRWRAEKAALVAFLLASSYGGSDEFHQRWTPTRTCDPLDAAADATGAAFACAAGIIISRTHRQSP